MKVILPYKDKPLLILGDFNLNLFEYDNNTHIDEFVNSMISNSLFPLVNNDTYYLNAIILFNFYTLMLTYDCLSGSSSQSFLQYNIMLYDILHYYGTKWCNLTNMEH